jgi:DNA-binding NarL/FixJ family response regulator
MRHIRVLLVDDHTVVRQGLRSLLEGETDISVVGEAQNGREAVVLAKRTLPDVVLMDVAMPILNGVEATRQVLRNLPDTKVLALTSYGDDDYVAQFMEVGGHGYLVKQTAADDLIKAIREVQRGKRFFSPSVAKQLRQQRLETHGQGESGAKPGTLTSRECEVLQLIAEGFANKQVAAELSISIKTVEKHRQQVMNKLDIHDIARLTRYAISRGWVEAGTPSPP